MDILNNEYSHECDNLKNLVKMEETCPCISIFGLEKYNKTYIRLLKNKIKEDESNGI